MEKEHKNVFSELSETEAIRLILEGTAADVGKRFFGSLVENVSKSLRTTGALVTEYRESERRLQSLAIFWDGKMLENFEYSISGTACEKVIVKKEMVHITNNLFDLFKGNTDIADFENFLRTEGVISYLGVPLLDSRRNVLGHLSVLDTQPIPRDPKILNIFRIFSNRGSAELQRLGAEKQIAHKEAKLRKLFDSTIDAILEIDKEFNVLQINSSGERLLRAKSAHIVGRNLSAILSEPDYKKIANLSTTLQKMPKDQTNLWIPGTLEVTATDGLKIPAEGTLSRFELDGKDYFSLFLKDIRAKLKAESKIRSLASEKEFLKAEIDSLRNEIIGDSELFNQVLEKVRQVAQTNAAVLITGETGTGKEAIARAIHSSSKRKDSAMIIINCAAIAPTLIESEFFGHEKGAFTGAIAKHQGRFSLADKGTIFLDEIGELPIEMQAKLLRVLQEGEFEPVGSSRTLKTDVRIIAATHRNLFDAMDKGKFRQDLYYRLNVFPIEIPPLRERGDDVGKLAAYFLSKFCSHMGRALEPLTARDIELLKSYSWPGNVRELQNLIERAIIVSDGRHLNLQSIFSTGQTAKAPSVPEKPPSTASRILTTKDIVDMERENLLSALQQTGWRVSGKKGAARLLDMNPSTFVSRMKKLSIKRP